MGILKMTHQDETPSPPSQFLHKWEKDKSQKESNPNDLGLLIGILL